MTSTKSSISSVPRERHPFAALLTQIRVRKAGLTQTRLAELAGYDQAILVRMCQGKKDLTGPSGRDRIIRIMTVLNDMGVLSRRSEADALLAAAGQPPLYAAILSERSLLDRLQDAPTTLPPDARHQPPATTTSLIGRDVELDEILSLLSRVRIMTLTGPGGVGKTQLGIEVANRAAKAFEHGACFVPLSALTASAQVPEALASALELRLQASQSEADAVKRYLRNRHMLLVLDNCEHVPDAAPFVAGLLAESPRVKVIATSREPLQISGEHVFALNPLAPAAAVALFVQRAQAQNRQFAGQAASQDIAALCEHLDCLPLAIEIAAARIRQFTPAMLLARVRQTDAVETASPEVLHLLSNARRDTPARHESVRSMIGWSYTLLTTEEQRLFRQLAIFRGGAQIEQIQSLHQKLAVPAHGPNGNGLADQLRSLVEKSLVVAVEQPDETVRFDMLSLTHGFALEQLRACGEFAAAQRCHADVFADYSEQVYEGFARSGNQTYFMNLERERLNIRQAINSSFDGRADPLNGCRLVAALQLPWRTLEPHVPELRRWFTHAQQAVTPDMPPAVLGGVLRGAMQFGVLPKGADQLDAARTTLKHYERASNGAGIADTLGYIAWILMWSNPHDPQALSHLQAGIQLARTSGYLLIEHCLAEGVYDQLMMTGQTQRALETLHDVIGSCEKTGDAANLAMYLNVLVGHYMATGRFDDARATAGRVSDCARQINDLSLFMLAQANVAECERLTGNQLSALQTLDALIASAQRTSEPLTLRYPKIILAKALNDLGQPARAQSVMCDLISETLADRGLAPGWFAYLFDVLASSATLTGDPARAAVLFGLRARGSHNETEFGRYRAQAATALGAAQCDALVARGRGLTLTQAVDEALKGMRA